MEDLSLDSCGEEDAAPGAKGWPAPQARVHFRVTRFIMEAGNRGREESQSRAGGTWRPGSAGRGQRCGAPVPGGGDPHHAEPAWLGRGKRSGLNRASAFRHALGTRL